MFTLQQDVSSKKSFRVWLTTLCRVKVILLFPELTLEIAEIEINPKISSICNMLTTEHMNLFNHCLQRSSKSYPATATNLTINSYL